MIRLLVMADGRSVHTDRWCRYFADHGFEVALFTLEPSAGASYRVYQGRRPTGVGMIDYRLARRDMHAAVRDFGPDVISAHYIISYGWLASFCTACPVVVTAWGSDLLRAAGRSLLHRRRITRAMAHASYCTVDNENLRRAAAEYIEPGRVVRVLFGIDRHAFTDIVKSSFPTAGPVRIIAPRGFQPVYDPDTVIRAAALVRGRIETWIELLGDKERGDELMQEIQKRSLGDIVSVHPFIPNHNDFHAVLCEYDIYLSASLSDSTSVALLQAMSAGVFPIVTDIEGNREWITPGRNGLLFEPKSASSLAGAIIRAVGMRKRFAAVAVENRRIIESQGIWEDNMERVVALYRELAGK
jgi:L-malate glycosyltransferase